MSEQFDAIEYEVKINNAWVRLTADVLAVPSTEVNGIGITSTDPLERIGAVSSMTFSLNNSEANSAQTRGYYTPGGASSLNGWRTGLYIRLYFVYDGKYKGAFYGRIAHDGIKVASGVYGPRRVDVTCYGWMREAEKASMEMLEYQTNKSANEGIEIVLDNMRNKPLVRSLQSGVSTFPSIFDITYRDTKAVAELTKLAGSELGFVYIRGDHAPYEYEGGETFVFENRQHRYGQRNTVKDIPKHSSEPADFLLKVDGDNLLLVSGDKIKLIGSEPAIFGAAEYSGFSTTYGSHLFNRVRITSYPRRVDDSPVVLWNLERPIEIEAGGTVSNLRGSYRDPDGKVSSVSGINMVAPVSGTDYEAFENDDGTGTDLTANLSVSASYGVAEVEYTLTNTGATTLYVTTLQARGQGVYVYDSASVLYTSEASILAYGISETNFDLPYVSDATNLFRFSNNIDRLLFVGGDNILLVNGDYLHSAGAAGIFDILIPDDPTYYIEGAVFNVNRSKRLMLAFMSIEAGDPVKISEPMTEIDTEYSYIVNGYGFSILPTGIVEWRPVLVSALAYPKI